MFVPVLVRGRFADGGLTVGLGDEMVDDYLEFVAARAAPNTLLATAFDLKVFFTAVGKAPVAVTTADVFDFLRSQRRPRRGDNVVGVDGERGLSARTIARRLSSVRGLFAYLVARGDLGVSRNPVPAGLAARRSGGRRSGGRVPLVKTPRTMPRVLNPGEVDRLIGALRTDRDRAIVAAMLLGGLRRCEVLGLRLNDINVGERRVFIAAGKGGRQRIVPVAAGFFMLLDRYLGLERPMIAGVDHVFVVLKGSRRGAAFTASGLDEILDGARRRAGLNRGTCHQLRHTCFTRLREAGMSLEAIQAQAGHASIESTRIYVHLANEWLASEYFQAVEAIERDEASR